MGTFVDFQKSFFQTLFEVKKRNPELLRRWVGINALGGILGTTDQETLHSSFNFTLPSGNDWEVEVYQKVLKESITVTDKEIVIDYQLGNPLPPRETYNLDHLKHMSGSGDNMLRTKTLAQP